MAMALTEEQLMLQEAASGFLAEKAPVAQLRSLRDAEDECGFLPEVWQGMVEMGWPGIVIPESFGGFGYNYTALGVVLEQVGRNLTISPIESTVLVAVPLIMALASPSQKAELLPTIASGSKLFALVLQEGAHHAPEHTAMKACLDGDHYNISGSKHWVLDVPVADHFIVIARTSGVAGEQRGLSAFLVDANADGVSVERHSRVDSRSVGTVNFDSVALPVTQLLGKADEAWAGLNYALDIANIGLASELLGLSAEAFERTVSYLKERQQFGHVIGSFQGLQHRAATMFAELELARSTVLKALQAIDNQDEQLSMLASAAKAKLCEVANQVTNEAIQMHGGIGMTDEHDIGFFIKRARVIEHCFGGYHYHLDRFAKLSGY